MAAGMSPDRVFRCSDIEEAWAVLRPVLTSGDLVLLKGSRLIGLEALAEKIRDRAHQDAERRM